MTNINCKLHMGIDVGSTTVKVVIIDDNDKILFAEYRRHGGSAANYMKLFTFFNVIFLVVLTLLALVQLHVMGI